MLTYAESPAIPGCASCKKIRSQVLCTQAVRLETKLLVSC